MELTPSVLSSPPVLPSCPGDGRVFALKEVPMEGMSRAEREETLDEARVLARLDSK